jgi:hypothetical protein
MLQRRVLLAQLGSLGASELGVCALAASAWAQRPAQPIARPPRPNRPLVPGRLGARDSGGVAAGPLPGVFVVVAVDSRAGTLQLRDEGGRTGVVHVDPELFDLESLKAGDKVEVDFLLRGPDSTKLEAAGIWKV